jgi:hypothetical protein
MGLSALGALLFVTLALIGQSPGVMRRLGLDVYRLDLRVRAFTGYAFACLLLIAGFFIAGVPIGAEEPEPVAQGGATTPEPDETSPISNSEDISPTSPITATLSLTDTATSTATRPASGAMGGVASRTPTVDATAGAEATTVEGVTPDIPTPTDEGAGVNEEGTPLPTATGTPTPVSTNTPSPTPTFTPTPTPSETPTTTPTPTATATPSLTPTPVEGPTAAVDSDGANIWIYRSPGGQELVLVSHGETLLLLTGHANQGGALWREVQTLQGVDGWIEERFLNFGTGQ